ncbi:alpha-1,2-mannosyltransferase ALG9 isoform X1 [Daphnia magna]|uniref:alpha-1,2-mannosyltransferase ALG9 isoform X1 n=1 Tax=Daphnia magna TaxID=35525 RepID=UPI0006DE65E4|nr:alpha-1,2-mannosyltransferase ALG9 isoform X1 [Daphnia magna]
MGPKAKTKSIQNRKIGGKSDHLSREKQPEKVTDRLKEGFHRKEDTKDIWSPNIKTVFKALASARLCAAVWNNITDCDETYNYWEPLHHLLFGSGFQTWEYSPVFALRSYLFLHLYALPAWIYGLIFHSNQVLVFYFLRWLLGFASTTCETYFYKGVLQQFGPKVGRLTFLFLLFSAGMFQSSSSFLPSTFSMYMTLLLMGAWFQGNFVLAVLSTAISAFLSWPFAGIIGIGIAVDALVLRKKWRMFISWCIISTFVILIPIILVDSYHYGRLVVAPLNIVLYNVFSGHGPDLYGTSPWTFYFLNGFLNFNFIFPLALVALPAHLITRKLKPIKNQSFPIWLALLPLYVWILIFFTQPHKEERFLYPIYPLFGLAGAITWTCAESCLRALKLSEKFVQSVTLALVISSSIVSVSRIVGQYRGYHAPMDVFLELNRLSWENEGDTKEYNVCVGKEWHRFPSSFFLPNNMKLRFIPSEFRGQLPRPFDPPPNGTWTIPPYMNDLNKEEPTRYATLKDCHYLVDLETGQATEREPQYSQMTSEWEIIFQVDFLDNARSPQFLRAFYIPWFSETYCKRIPYVLLKRRPISNKKKRQR